MAEPPYSVDMLAHCSLRVVTGRRRRPSTITFNKRCQLSNETFGNRSLRFPQHGSRQDYHFLRQTRTRRSIRRRGGSTKPPRNRGSGMSWSAGQNLWMRLRQKGENNTWGGRWSEGAAEEGGCKKGLHHSVSHVPCIVESFRITYLCPIILDPDLFHSDFRIRRTEIFGAPIIEQHMTQLSQWFWI